MGRKHLVYSGTRNLYKYMEASAKSVVANSDVSDVHFLIEDPKFPSALPDIVSTMDVSKQKFFSSNGANFKTKFTYMSLLRVCYTYLFPDLDRILQLDCDTIAVDDISDIWDIEMGGTLFAAVEEKVSSYKPYGEPYFNIGVALFNLKTIKAHGADEKLATLLNEKELQFIDQDAWNYLYMGEATRLATRYNESSVTGYTDNPAIVHYAGRKQWWDNPRMPRREYLRKYLEMPWEEALERHSEHVG